MIIRKEINNTRVFKELFCSSYFVISTSVFASEFITKKPLAFLIMIISFIWDAEFCLLDTVTKLVSCVSLLNLVLCLCYGRSGKHWAFKTSPSEHVTHHAEFLVTFHGEQSMHLYD